MEKYGDILLDMVNRYVTENKIHQPEMPEVPVKRAKKTKSSGTEVVADLAAKTPRIDTKEISYSMFRQGMDIEEIARKRELVTGTIAGLWSLCTFGSR